MPSGVSRRPGMAAALSAAVEVTDELESACAWMPVSTPQPHHCQSAALNPALLKCMQC